MSRTSTIRFELARMRRELLQLSFDLAFGKPQQEGEADRIGKRLEQMSNHLRIMMRDLNSSAHQLEFLQQDVRRNVPREHRWSASESVNQKLKNVADAYDEARQLAAAVNDLLIKNGLMTPPELAKELMENLDKAFGHEMGMQTAEIQHIAKGPTASADHLPLHESPEVAVMKLGIFAYLGLKWLAKKWSKPRPQ